MAGWAADQQDCAPVSSVQILIVFQVAANAAIDPLSLHDALPICDSRYTNSGWSFSYNIGSLAAGAHAVKAVATDSGALSADRNSTRVNCSHASISYAAPCV